VKRLIRQFDEEDSSFETSASGSELTGPRKRRRSSDLVVVGEDQEFDQILAGMEEETEDGKQDSKGKVSRVIFLLLVFVGAHIHTMSIAHTLLSPLCSENGKTAPKHGRYSIRTIYFLV
jgi:hypothetical protein